MSDQDLQPDLDDVLQAEPGGTEPTVRVAQQGPVRNQALPRKAGSTRTVGGITTAPYRILRANPRRASAYIIADAAIYVALSNAAAADVSAMALWPANLPLLVTATVDIWVAAQTGTADVSAIVEYWATGEGDD